MLKITTKINGEVWSEAQLDWIQRERRIHTLHELKRLGATLNHNGKPLSHDDINFLTSEELPKVLLAAKLELGVDGFKKLYKEQLERADEMWREIEKKWTPDSKPLDSGFEMDVRGTSLDGAMQTIATLTPEEMLGANPEHFALTDDGESKYGAEIPGMYGAPLAGIINYEDVFGENAPAWVEKEDGFREKTGGFGHLTDGTVLHISTTLAMKPTDTGFIFKSTIHWPAGTPIDLVEGHKIHLAIEYLECFRFATAKQEATPIEAEKNYDGDSYDIVAATPMGNQDGKLILKVNGNKLSGVLAIMGKENPFSDGTIDDDGNISFGGKIKGGIAKVDYSATGTITGGKIKLTLKSKMGDIAVASK